MSEASWKVVTRHHRYQVSDEGDVVGPRAVLKPVLNDGYLKVSISGKLVGVHTLVLETFVGPCPAGMECCHEDGNAKNNRLSNLRWDTPKSNSEDRVRHGTQVHGEDCHSAKLTESDVDAIRRRYVEGGVTQKQLADEYHVHPHLIYLIVKGKVWKHLESAKIVKDFSNRRGKAWKKLIR